MSGFKAFILRGNLVELAVAFIIGAGVRRRRHRRSPTMLMGFIGKIGGQPDFAHQPRSPGVNVGQFINAADRRS